ncbi:MFS transporter [Litorimonas cladophorae]|uniref:MFS transporter n=1 Tax=Litorimonas cladophorae TaxID=1220491 RepID=A0A918KKM6_9PROT|nr:peptide MFS transporter [Litorimonas cladophorae]GGX64574.1 MFS transporter [Litorimonas cladophorae]
MAELPGAATAPVGDKQFFGHPKGLQTLFLTEMWERMSYYGMRGLLVLFMTAAIAEGGLGIGTATAVAIYGLYTASVYFMGLPGGWIADRLIGSQKAIWYGGIVIMCGHIVLAIPSDKTFFLGLILVVLGTGLLKPNISAVVGQLYSSEDKRRDSGYALYYMGINIGSFIGYTVCGFLYENNGIHWAFGASAIGMALGLIYFWFTRERLQGAGAAPAAPLSNSGQKKSWTTITAFLVLVAAVTALLMSGTMSFDPIAASKFVAVFFLATFVVYFLWVYLLGNLNAVEKKGMLAFLLICVASTMFWSGFEQAGSSLNLFGQDFTDRSIGGFEIPTTWLQNANPFFIITLTPLFALFWIWLGKRMITPGYGLKCGAGLIIMGLGFVVMIFAAHAAADGKVAIFWLVLTYFLHTVGELVLSPISLSAVSKLSPPRFLGQMMGLFVLTYSMGNIVAGLLAGGFDPENVAEMPALFTMIATFAIGVGAVVLLIGLFTKGWERDVEIANKKIYDDLQEEAVIASATPQ